MYKDLNKNRLTLLTAKFVISNCEYCKLQRDFVFFCSVDHFSEGRVDENHNVTCSPRRLAENDSRPRAKNSKGNRDGEWSFCRMKEADVALFLQVTRIRKFRNKCVANLTRRLLIARNRTITKQLRTLKRETNKTDRNPPITNHKS